LASSPVVDTKIASPWIGGKADPSVWAASEAPLWPASKPLAFTPLLPELAPSPLAPLPLAVVPLVAPLPAPVAPAWLPDAEPLLLPLANSICVGGVGDACEQAKKRTEQTAQSWGLHIGIFNRSAT
jgi:hypothetical protein